MTIDTDLRAYLDAHGTNGAPPKTGWYIVALAFDVAVVRVVHGACALVFTDPWTGATLPASGIARHAPLRLANLTAERDAANALITLGALLNLGPTATWREVSAAVAGLLDTVALAEVPRG